MTPERRNASVVIGLVAAMTVGAAVLLCFESWLFPRTPRWSDNIALTAERGLPIDEIEIGLAPDTAITAAMDGDESICEIDSLGTARWEPRGPRVRLFVSGAQGTALSDAQKRTLLDALGSLTQAGGRTVGSVPVRVAADCDSRQRFGLPEPAKDL